MGADSIDPVVYTLMRERGLEREDAEVRIKRQVASGEVTRPVEAAFPEAYAGAWVTDDLPAVFLALTDDESAWDYARQVIDGHDLLRGCVKLVPAKYSLRELQELRSEVVAAVRALGVETLNYVGQKSNAVVIETVEDRPLTQSQRDGLARLRVRYADMVVIQECTASRFGPE